MNQLIKIRQQKLDDLFSKISLINNDAELQSHWARYLCILSYGYIEASVHIIITDYCEEKSNHHIASYVKSEIKRFQNLNMGKTLDLLAKFNPLWASNIENRVDAELKDSIDSIVNLRNQIAHGANVSTTYISIKIYYQNAIKVIKIIDEEYNN